MANSFKFQNTTVASGDLIRVHLKIVEGDKERIQIFEGLVIAIKGSSENQMITVRKIASGGIGVERIFPVVSPWVTRIEVKKTGKVRRAKLFYLREKTRKETREVTHLQA